MEIYNFDKDMGKISEYNSDFVMSHIIKTNSPSLVGSMYLDGDRVIGYHQAVAHQLLLVMDGEGYVRNDFGFYRKFQAGNAVFWEKGEFLETKSKNGLLAVVIESEELNPLSFMFLEK
ncbi:cupin [Virgibacillus necropolis]|uniref:cupin n=1 Tax=Virgibacillus necropolis TaxID=163877 RepID=UPI003850B33B